MLQRIFGAMCLLGLTTLTLAQEAPTGLTRYLVATDNVKPELVTVWQDLQKNEVVPALKKAGVNERKVYRTVLGNTTEFISYLPFPDYGEMDDPDALERALGKAAADNLKARLNACLLSTNSRLENSRNEFFIDLLPAGLPVSRR